MSKLKKIFDNEEIATVFKAVLVLGSPIARKEEFIKESQGLYKLNYFQSIQELQEQIKTLELDSDIKTKHALESVRGVILNVTPVYSEVLGIKKILSDYGYESLLVYISVPYEAYLKRKDLKSNQYLTEKIFNEWNPLQGDFIYAVRDFTGNYLSISDNGGDFNVKIIDKFIKSPVEIKKFKN